ncbi:MAG: hypothetical protein IPG45_31435 [Deltaproteobacteria bacterium]|jgi:hypothetical protein|nr:hypothetical protein [Deltaproteobacteria bacterium]
MGPVTTDDIDLRPAWRRLGLPEPSPGRVARSAPSEVRSTLEVALADLKLESRSHTRGILLAGAGLLVVLMAVVSRSETQPPPSPVASKQAPPPVMPAVEGPAPESANEGVPTTLRGERTMRPLPKRTKLPRPRF